MIFADDGAVTRGRAASRHNINDRERAVAAPREGNVTGRRLKGLASDPAVDLLDDGARDAVLAALGFDAASLASTVKKAPHPNTHTDTP